MVSFFFFFIADWQSRVVHIYKHTVLVLQRNFSERVYFRYSISFTDVCGMRGLCIICILGFKVFGYCFC